MPDRNGYTADDRNPLTDSPCHISSDDIIRFQRAAVVTESKTWLRTPFHHGNSVKGAGADCRFIAAVYAACGLVPKDVAAEYHPPDWNLHRDEEHYLLGVEPYAVEIDTVPNSGDFVLWKFGRAFAHAALVVAWPTIIHAFRAQPVQYDDAQRMAELNKRDRKTFTLRAWR